MEFKGSEIIHAGQGKVFDFLTDPLNFSNGIPDIQDVKVLGPGRFQVVAKLGISMIKTSFTINFDVSETVPSSHVKLRGHGLGSNSAIDLEITVDLKGGAKETVLEWSSVATVSGMLASLGQRVLGGVADKLVKEVFGNLHKALESQGPERVTG